MSPEQCLTIKEWLPYAILFATLLIEAALGLTPERKIKSSSLLELAFRTLATVVVAIFARLFKKGKS